MKKITGAKIDGKIVKVIESKPYEEGKIEVFFMYNGITRCGAIVLEEDLITEELTEIEIKTKELINLINEKVNAEIDVDNYDEYTYVYIEGNNYIVNVLIDGEGYLLDTYNKNMADKYNNDENKYKNRITRKTSKGVINYIKRFI
ncbi:MAG: hypothetical protein ACLR4X_11170 [Clostridia bacterium]